MNVVGKVGSLITQGVYSVATPFHPFGGAVDIIVVQQQDGSFRSTPWYVQFGKFQGVLKGAEKVVRINVNGVEANFNMYLDNSGEAYFIREAADSDQDNGKNQGSKDEREQATLEHSLSVDNDQCNINKDSVDNYRLQSTLSDPGVLRDDYSSFRSDRLERTDSDMCRFYDFQDDQSLEGSVELSSEFGSSRYDNMDMMETFVEAQGSDSEMVLVSVDGHILTAPISSSEQDTENVQLETPQFHLGPGEGNGFCEGDRAFTVAENAWDSQYLNDLDASSGKLHSRNASYEGNNTHSHESQSESCKVEEHSFLRPGSHGSHQLEVQQDEGTIDMHDPKSCEEEEEHVPQKINVLEAFEEDGKSDKQCEGKGRRHELETGEDEEEHVHGNLGVGDMQQAEAWEEDREHAHQVQKASSIKNQERDLYVFSEVEDSFHGTKNEDKFKSCLDLTSAAVGETSECEDSPLGSQEGAKVLNENSYRNVPISSETDTECAPGRSSTDVGAASDASYRGVVEAEMADVSSPSPSFTAVMGQISQDAEIVHTSVDSVDSDCMSVGNASVCNNEEVSLNPTAKDSSERDIFETEPNRTEAMDTPTRSSSEQTQAKLSSTFEISLCGHLLRPGMGLSAADEAFNAHRVSKEEFRSAAVSVIKNDNLVIRYRGKYLPWDTAAPYVLGMVAFGLDLPIECKDAIAVEQEVTQKLVANDSGSASGRRWRLWPIAFRRVKTVQHSNSNSSEEVFVDSESFSPIPSVDQTPTSQSGIPSSEAASKSLHKKIVRTNIPTNEQILSMNLKEGQNDVTFSFSTRVLGLQQVEAHIYLWKWNARIVISDVDGTITKSDVLGQFMPLVGKDWSQSGVARLFSAIKENGYQLLFLSARAIVQAYLTKSFLFNLKQDGKTLPNGPVVISPNGLFPSLFREVIRRAPHEFKIACLEDIKALFPPDYNPFYAGFGNRDTDELTYRKIGIPKGKIFIINPKGEVAINHRIDVKSYTSLHTLVNDMFPPTSMVEQEDYNSWNYWKMPLPDIEL